MSKLLERLIRYVKIDTQADETSSTYPSTLKQLDLSRLLEQECRELGLMDVEINEHGIVTAEVPSTVDHPSPKICWVAHVDTSPEFSSEKVNPIVHENYQGDDIPLPNAPGRIIRVEENPDLKDLIGTTIITTDGTTLLGGDDKAGIAIMMTAADYLLNHPEIPHGPICLCFTCDEEIGHGTDHIVIEKLNCQCAYTLDGGGAGEIDSETFSADVATVTVKGVNTHPSIGYGDLLNAIKLLSHFIDQLPKDSLSPETTRGRDGFVHPYHFEGSVAEASARIILRDFETENLKKQAELLESIAEKIKTENPRAEITVAIKEQYRNLREGLKKEPRALSKAIEATKNAGMEPKLSIIRGGTDGSILTEKGLPTPNLSSGQHNPHSPLEWASLSQMESAVNVLVELAQLWGQEES